RNPLHRLEISFGRDRKAGFDNVHLQPLELPRHLQLLFHIHAETGSLFSISQCRVENCDSVHVFLLSVLQLLRRVRPTRVQEFRSKKSSENFSRSLPASSNPTACTTDTSSSAFQAGR